MGLVLDWQRKLGYRKDPFLDKPDANFIGQEKLKEKINLFLLKNQRLGIVQAEKGMGMSSFLIWLKKQLKKKMLIIPADIKSEDALEKFLRKKCVPIYKQELFRKVYHQMTNETIDPHKQMLLEIKKNPHLFIFEGDVMPSMVGLLNQIMRTSHTQIILLNARKNLLQQQVIMKAEFGKYTDSNLVTILQTRIESAGSVGTFPFDAKEIKKLLTKAKGKPSTLLAAAKNRAMELSLKGLPLPERPKPVQEETAEGDKKEPKKFNLFGKIQFEVREETKKRRKPKKNLIKEDPPEPPKKKTAEEVEEQSADEELLAAIVSSIDGKQK